MVRFTPYADSSVARNPDAVVVACIAKTIDGETITFMFEIKRIGTVLTLLEIELITPSVAGTYHAQIYKGAKERGEKMIDVMQRVALRMGEEHKNLD